MDFFFFGDLYRTNSTQLSLRERTIVCLRNSDLNSEAVVSKVVICFRLFLYMLSCWLY
jgi:hypothetical protein